VVELDWLAVRLFCALSRVVCAASICACESAACSAVAPRVTVARLACCWVKAACACCTAISRSVVSRRARVWPALTVCPTATSISASFPELLKLSGTLAGLVIGPVAATATWTLPWVTGVVW
jgi:hypothetical protein